MICPKDPCRSVHVALSLMRHIFLHKSLQRLLKGTDSLREIIRKHSVLLARIFCQVVREQLFAILLVQFVTRRPHHERIRSGSAGVLSEHKFIYCFRFALNKCLETLAPVLFRHAYSEVMVFRHPAILLPTLGPVRPFLLLWEQYSCHMRLASVLDNVYQYRMDLEIDRVLVWQCRVDIIIVIKKERINIV